MMRHVEGDGYEREEQFLPRDVLGMSTTSIDDFLTAGSALEGAARPPVGRGHGELGGIPAAQRRGRDEDEEMTFPSKWSQLTPDVFRVEVDPKESRDEMMHHYGAASDFPDQSHNPRTGGRLTSVVVLLGTVCVVTLAIDGGWPAGEGTAVHEEGSKFGCDQFLCPHSGECWGQSSQCPEGNPFWQKNSAYSRLAQCGELIRGTQDLPRKCQMPVVVLRWGLTMSDGCLAFLCPGSGACVAAPHECPEGNPFSNATSLYWGQALATQHGPWARTPMKGPSSNHDDRPDLGSIVTIKVPPAGGGEEDQLMAGRSGSLMMHHHAASQHLNRIIRRSQSRGGGMAEGVPGSIYGH